MSLLTELAASHSTENSEEPKITVDGRWSIGLGVGAVDAIAEVGSKGLFACHCSLPGTPWLKEPT